MCINNNNNRKHACHFGSVYMTIKGNMMTFNKTIKIFLNDFFSIFHLFFFTKKRKQTPRLLCNTICFKGKYIARFSQLIKRPLMPSCAHGQMYIPNLSKSLFATRLGVFDKMAKFLLQIDQIIFL